MLDSYNQELVYQTVNIITAVEAPISGRIEGGIEYEPHLKPNRCLPSAENSTLKSLRIPLFSHLLNPYLSMSDPATATVPDSGQSFFHFSNLMLA